MSKKNLPFFVWRQIMLEILFVRWSFYLYFTSSGLLLWNVSLFTSNTTWPLTLKFLRKIQIFLHNLSNPCIFRETKFRDRKFPDRTLQEGTFGDQKIPGIPICHGIWEIIFGENSRISFQTGQKIPGFLNQLNSRSENSLTEFSKTFYLSRTVDLEFFFRESQHP